MNIPREGAGLEAVSILDFPSDLVSEVAQRTLGDNALVVSPHIVDEARIVKDAPEIMLGRQFHCIFP
jgi:hypothetical protein